MIKYLVRKTATMSKLGTGKYTYTMDQIMNGFWLDGKNGDPNIYRSVLEQFGPVMYGKSDWKQVVTRDELSKFYHWTDEAMMLWFLENNYESWVGFWAYKVSGKQPNADEVPRPKYTEQSKKVTKGSADNAKIYTGWNQPGKDRWNTLCKLVKSARKRKERKQFETDFLKFNQEKGAPKKKVTPAKVADRPAKLANGLDESDQDDDDGVDEGEEQDKEDQFDGVERVAM